MALSQYYPAVTFFGDIIEQQTNGGTSGINNASGVIVAPMSASVPTTKPKTVTVTTIFNEIVGSYLLLDFGGRDAQADLAFQLMKVANWQHDLAMQQVMLAVLDAYTSYIGNKALVAASEQDLKDAELLLEAALKMRNAGLATMTDVLSAQSTQEQMRFNLEQARGAEKTALADLLIALGLSPDTEICVANLPDELPVIEISGNVCSLIALAKERRPEIASAMAAVREEYDQLRVSYSSGMPTLNLTASANRLHFLQPKKAPSLFNNAVAVEWNVPLFQGFFM